MNATVEVWVIVDEAGEYAAGHTAEAAAEDYEARHQELKAVATRRVKVTLTVPRPETVEVVGVIAAVPEAYGDAVSASPAA